MPALSVRQRRFVIAGIMLSVFMASMESTVVATAMPTIAGQLGGLERYSWVFAAYLLTSTTTVPIFGKLSDLYGRRTIYAAAMGVFLVGSLLCGLAQTMNQLVWARALQGLGAGGVLPLAFIMIGEMFTFQERARMQGFFSGVWGVSSVVGPLLGGFIVDRLTWHWVFYVNLLPGLIAFAFVWTSWRDAPRSGSARVAVDYVGAALLSASVIALMVGLQQGGALAGTGALVTLAIVLFTALLWWERRVRDPILPLALFRGRLFSIAIAHGVLSGWAMFGSLSFVPLFVQVVMGTSATAAGIAMTPMLLSWVLASIVGSRLLLRVDYKRIAMAGMASLTLGALLMSFADASTSRMAVMFDLALMGTGMGLSIPAFLIAVQSTVERSSLGTATSMLQFSRSIGGTLGVGVMGAILSARLAAGLRAAGEAADMTEIGGLLAGGEGAVASGIVVSEGVRVAVASGIAAVFMLAFAAAVLGLIATSFAPGGQIAAMSHRHEPAATEAPEPAPAPAVEG
jgi:EmrB/QacA subfamily drug resistance transporter